MSTIDVFTSVDLEMNQPSRKIIQIGACIGNISTGQVLEKLSVFVNPYEQLNPAITDLTKITQEDVDNGVSLETAYRQLQSMHEYYKAFVNPITWGGGDSQELLEQLQKENSSFQGWCFGRRWIDVKTLFVCWRLARKQPIQGGLARSMIKLSLTFQGQKHNAQDDAINTFRMYCAMLKKFRE